MEIRKSSKSRHALSAFAALCAGAFALLAASPAPRAALPGIIPLSEIRPGMKGYGLTVAHGDTVEKFGVEVIGVVPNATPGRTSIIVRLSGLGLEESGIVAGMSGSPVYLDGRLAGAVATGWGFTKGPIGGVTPIEAMLAMAGDGAGEGVGQAASSGAGIRAAEVTRALSQPQEERVATLEGLSARLRLEAPRGASPLLAPLASGFPVEALERHRDSLAALFPAGAPLAETSTPPSSGAAPQEHAPRMEGGSAITALLVEGDLQLGATGTVTAVLPDGRFVAFGHPFLGLGELALPVAPARVVSFLPNVYQSFKIAYAGRPAWRLVRDRDSGVSGATDRTAPMVPVTLHFTAENVDRTFRFGVAPHPKLLPLLLSIASDAALTLADPTPRDRTLRYRVSYDTAAGTVAYEDVASGARAKDLALLTASVLGNAIEENDLGDPRISAVRLEVSSEPGERRARIASAALASHKVRPGETLVATVRLVDRRGEETVKTVRVPVPREMPEGKAQLLIADGSTGSSMRLALDPAEPRTLAEFKRLLDQLVPTDRLFAAIVVGGRASATGSATLTSLPPTAAALLAAPGENTESLRANVPARLLSQQVIAVGRPVAGSARLEFEVERSRF